MSNPFAPATKKKSFLRMTLFGPSGSGKTYSALNIAQHLTSGGKIAVIDTERGSASKYAGDFTFDVVELAKFSPRDYIAMIKSAAANGYDVLIIDSLTHAWSGTGGVLEIVDDEAARSQSKNSYAAWRKGTPEHNALIDAMLNAPLHIIATMRSKTEYVLETDARGKQAPRKIGLAPIQRDGMEYEFDVVGEMNMDNALMVSKTRCSALNNAVIEKPGAEIAETLRAWLSDGIEPPTPPTIEDEPEQDHTPARRAVQDDGWDGPNTQEEAEAYYEPVHDRTRDTASELDEYFPRDETPPAALDAANWTLDKQAVGKFIAFARETWATDGEKPLTFPHLANRICKALALDGTAKNRAELDALLETYTGSKQAAAEAVRTYKSEA